MRFELKMAGADTHTMVPENSDSTIMVGFNCHPDLDSSLKYKTNGQKFAKNAVTEPFLSEKDPKSSVRVH